MPDEQVLPVPFWPHLPDCPQSSQLGLLAANREKSGPGWLYFEVVFSNLHPRVRVLVSRQHAVRTA